MKKNRNRQRTEAQKLAARLNGAKSRGPQTPEGKAVSSQNATKHGLTSRRVVLHNEVPEAWDDFIQALSDEWQPEGPTELQIIHDLAAARWRLNRLLDIETETVDLEMARGRAVYDRGIRNGTEKTRIAIAWQALTLDGTLPGIHRHETRLRKIVRDAQNQLIELQSLRRQEHVHSQSAPERNEPEPATHEQAPALQNEPGPVVDQPVTKTQNEPGPVADQHAPGLQNKPGNTAPSPLLTRRPAPETPAHTPEQRPERIPPGSRAA